MFTEWGVLFNWQIFRKNKNLVGRTLNLIMSIYRERGNVVEGLNNRLDLGPKAEAEQAREGKSIPWKISWEVLSRKKLNLKLPENECLPPDYLAGRDPELRAELLSVLYRQDIGDWQLGCHFPQASFPSSLVIVALYVAGSGMLIP